MRLTVLSVAYPFAPVGPHAVGGAERILGDLDRALTAAGHNSLVVACEGSVTTGRLFPIALRQPPFDEAARTRTAGLVQSAIDAALKTYAVDLVHLHGFDFHRYRLPRDFPVLVTVHLPVSWYPPGIWSASEDTVHFQFVSESQRVSAPAHLRDAPVIPNGVALLPSTSRPKAPYALTMGRICPEKNQHAALDAGSRANLPVLLAGRVFPYAGHVEYFQREIEPRLQSPHRFLGSVSGERKRHLLARARCLLHPTLAPETSSLVALEALAAGTPVIAYRSGALCEIVRHGLNGFLVDDVPQMADAIAGATRISPGECRRSVEAYSLERMIGGYFSLYRSLSSRHALQSLCGASVPIGR